MESARQRVLNDFPYPVAFPYAIALDHERDLPSRRWALCFTEYQLLRMVCLPLVSQYLREEIQEESRDSVSAVNRAIAAIRCPFFSDWITLVHTLRRHLPKLIAEPLFPRLPQALDALKESVERPVGLRDRKQLDPLSAILALRNEIGHGGLVKEEEAREHLEVYLPVLHQVLEAFDFLGDCSLQVCVDPPAESSGQQAQVLTLRGATLTAPLWGNLSDTAAEALSESNAIFVAPSGKTIPLYPLLNSLSEVEPLFLYDGHHGIRVQTQQGPQERSYIQYLGTYHRAQDEASCVRLKTLLAQRNINFFLEKQETAPWSIADSAADYSRRTLEELRGTKYFPECYLPFVALEEHIDRFLRVPEPDKWPKETSQRRYINGLLLSGSAGAGKTAFLARQVERLLQSPAVAEPGRDNPNLVLFLRGNGVSPRPDGMSLFRDLAEKLGLSTEVATAKGKSHGGFGTFRELLDHLHSRWKQDRVSGRRLILVLDALNEAPFAEPITREALEMVAVAACFPWCKVVLSTRQEWLFLWSRKMGPQESSPLEELRSCLYVLPDESGPQTIATADNARQETPTQRVAEPTGKKGPPVVSLEPLTETQAGAMYEQYRASAPASGDGRGYVIPACLTAWSDLPDATRTLLLNPLYVYLFMRAFDNRPAEGLASIPILFRHYVEHAVQQRPGLWNSVETVLAHLLVDVDRPSADLDDDDANAIRRTWSEGLSPQEARLTLSPLEALAHAGLVTKRVREEGGGYRFVFQQVAEYLVYLHLDRQRPADADLVAYWSRQAASAVAFPEYAGAFGFLLRDWAAQQRLDLIGPLAEASAPWLADVLVSFLIEQASTGYLPGQGSEAANSVARGLGASAGPKSAAALLQAGSQLLDRPVALAATAYFEVGRVALEALLVSQAENQALAYSLAKGLNDYGKLLKSLGQMDQAHANLRRAVELCQRLCAADRKNIEFGRLLGVTLNSLGIALLASKNPDATKEAHEACRRAVENCESLWQTYPDDLKLAQAYGAALIEETTVLYDTGRLQDAMTSCRMAEKIYKTLWRLCPGHVEIGGEYSLALSTLAALRDGNLAVHGAEKAGRQSVEVADALFTANPGSVLLARRLAEAARWLGVFLSNRNRTNEALPYLQRAIDVYASLRKVSPENVEITLQFAAYMQAISAFREANQLVDEILSHSPNHAGAVLLKQQLMGQTPVNGGLGSSSGAGLSSALSPQQPGALRRGATYIGSLSGQFAEFLLDNAGAFTVRIFSPIAIALMVLLFIFSLTPYAQSSAGLAIQLGIVALMCATWGLCLLDPNNPWHEREYDGFSLPFFGLNASGRAFPQWNDNVSRYVAVHRQLLSWTRFLTLVPRKALAVLWMAGLLAAAVTIVIGIGALLMEHWALGVIFLIGAVTFVWLVVRRLRAHFWRDLWSSWRDGVRQVYQDDSATDRGWLARVFFVMKRSLLLCWVLLANAPSFSDLTDFTGKLFVVFFGFSLAFVLIRELVIHWVVGISVVLTCLAVATLLRRGTLRSMADAAFDWIDRVASRRPKYEVQQEPLADDDDFSDKIRPPSARNRWLEIFFSVAGQALVVLKWVVVLGGSLALFGYAAAFALMIIYVVLYVTYLVYNDGNWAAVVPLVVLVDLPLILFAAALAFLFFSWYFRALKKFLAWVWENLRKLRHVRDVARRSYRLFKFKRKYKQLQVPETPPE
jgi:tetratricopeptide (TPR) repeat protein